MQFVAEMARNEYARVGGCAVQAGGGLARHGDVRVQVGCGDTL